MRRRIFGLLSALLAAVPLLLAGAASATPTHFAEMLTAANPWDIFSDQRITAEADLRIGLFELAVTGSHESGAGLGPSHVSNNRPLTYTHRFTPSDASATVVRASLAVMLIDDRFCDGPEWAEIGIDGNFWNSGEATLDLLRGNVTAYLTRANDSFDVVVSS